ncbi:MAG: hypothetical protein KDN05_07615 [Verrucomicrobiae bacterium]|nr:hypothetical protein [Verrucomicrobiae bacterium]
MATEDQVWDWLKQRVRTLDDPRLTTGAVRRLAHDLPEALDKINAEAALKFAEQGSIELAKAHIRIMNESHQGLDDVEKTSEMVLEPLRRRIEIRMRESEREGRKDPTKAGKLALHLLEETAKLEPLFALFHGDSHQRTELFDEVALMATKVSITYQKETGDDALSITILNKALPLAYSSSTRNRILENLKISEGNLALQRVKPIIEKLQATVDSDLTPKAKFEQIKDEILPLARDRFDESLGDHKLGDLIAITLKQVSIAAFNDSDDIETAHLAIRLALSCAQSATFQSQLRKDEAEVSEARALNLCANCGKSMGNPNTPHRIHMYGDLVRKFQQTQYRHGEIQVPRCTACAEKQKQVKASAQKTMWTIIGPLGGLGLLLLFGGAPIGFFFLLGGVLAGVIVHQVMIQPVREADAQARKHENIKKMLRKGWLFGFGPG